MRVTRLTLNKLYQNAQRRAAYYRTFARDEQDGGGYYAIQVLRYRNLASYLLTRIERARQAERRIG